MLACKIFEFRLHSASEASELDEADFPEKWKNSIQVVPSAKYLGVIFGRDVTCGMCSPDR